MKRKFLSLLMILTILSGVFFDVTIAKAAGNYTISTLEELITFANMVNSGNDFSNTRVILTADITMNTTSDKDGNTTPITDESGNLTIQNPTLWTPIGTSEHPFRGIFDGKGYKINGMVINSASDHQGLFGVAESATIYNVFVCNSHIKGNGNVGAVIGSAFKNSIISNCRNYNSYVYASSRAGGVVGWTDNSHAYNCVSYGSTYSNRCSGGIVGDVYSNGKVYNCVNFGTVNGKELVGAISGGSTRADIQNCLNAGTVLYKYGYMMAGGGGSRTLTNCYSIKNDTVNKGLSMGTGSKTALTFTDKTAVLNTPVTVNGTEYSKVVDALNAWVDARSDGIYYSNWTQDDEFPYLKDLTIGSVKSMNENTFEDVNPEDWYYDEVKYAYDNGLMNGVTDTQFYPENDTSRAMVVTILYRQEGEPAVGDPTFKDVLKNSWYTDAITWAAENKIVKGYNAASFGPDDPITREQMAAIIYRYSEYKGYNTDKRTSLDIFPDGYTVSGWAAENVQWAVAEKLINGIGTGRLAPQAEAERAQVATILMRYCTNLID